MAAYYNENDKFAAAWLRELMKAGLIADGEVDDRSIELVRPDDLRGFVQCHFFAGIGGWSYALRLAGWPDDREVWTGSCPCQPFSSAGAQAGGHDPRDLWPTWYQLIRECRPVSVFGEQVEAAIGHGWLDRLCDDLEREGYAVGPVCLPGPCVGAFDIRQRLWFVADAGRGRCEQERLRLQQWKPRSHRVEAGRDGKVGDVAESESEQHHGDWNTRRRRGELSDNSSMDDATSARCKSSEPISEVQARHETRLRGPEPRCAASYWADCEWLACTDGKWRPVEPGTFPLATGVPARVGRLRGYGNSIKPQVAQVFIEAYLSCE
jgi:DNA (cytosine-5)-methyltransferase 1